MKTYYLHCEFAPLAYTGASVAHLAYKRRMPCSANNISCSYIVPLYWRYVARTASPILPELAPKLGRTDQNRKKYVKKILLGSTPVYPDIKGTVPPQMYSI
jgi:hypothetical protein